MFIALGEGTSEWNCLRGRESERDGGSVVRDLVKRVADNEAGNCSGSCRW
jgi:hypothetical protein